MKKIIICTLLLIAALTTVAAAEKYAVLIAGTGAIWKDGDPLPPNNPLAVSGKDNTVPYERALWCDTYLMWEQLRLKGYKDENIFVLYGDGEDCNLKFLNSRYMSNQQENELLRQDKITDYPATKSKVQEVFTMLQTKSTADDFVFVWTFSHGSYDGVWESTFQLMPEDLSTNYVTFSAPWFAALTNPIPAYKKVYQMQQCYSGGFIHHLTTQPNNIVMTSTNANLQQASFADDRTKTGNDWYYEENERLNSYDTSKPPLFKQHYHGEFNFHIYNALAGETPVRGNTSYNNIPLSAADQDNNGVVSVQETYDWNIDQNSYFASEQAQLKTQHASWINPATTSLEYPTIVIQDDEVAQLCYKGLCAIPINLDLGPFYVDPTEVFTFAPNSECVLKAGKKITIGGTYQDPTNGLFTGGKALYTDATLRLEAGASVELLKDGVLTMDNTAVFGGTIKVGANAKLIIKRGTKFDNTIIEVANGGVVEVVDSPVIAENSSITVGDLSSITVMPNSCLNISGAAIFNAGSNLYGSSNTTSKIAVSGSLKVIGTSAKKVNISTLESITSYKSAANVEVIFAQFSNMKKAFAGSGAKAEILWSTFTGCNDGIALSNYAQFRMANCTLTGSNLPATSGVSIGYSGGSIKNNVISGYDKGINIAYASPVISNNKLENNLTSGLYVYGSGSMPNLAANAGVFPPVNNTIYNNGNTSTAQIQLVMNAKIKLQDGYNNIYSANNNIKRISQFAKPAYSSLDRLISANNYWGVSNVSNSLFTPEDGWVYYTNFSTIPYSANDGRTTDLSKEANLLKEGLELEENQLYDKANAKYNELINDYPQTTESYFAISRQPELYKSASMDLSNLTALLGEKIANNIWQDKDYLKSMLAKTYLASEEYNQATEVGLELINNAQDNEDLIHGTIIKLLAESMENNRGKSADNADNSSKALLSMLLTGDYSATDRADIAKLPNNFKLHSNYPNPFNPTTTIKFDLPTNSLVKLAVYDIAGHQVAVLANGMLNGGTHNLEFNGARLASGVYFYQLEAEGKIIGRNKMMLLK